MIACEMDRISRIAARYGTLVVEDAAQSANARYHGRFLGALDDIEAYSFHVTKNFICGEDGAFITNDRCLMERAEIIREKGTNRSQFFRGEVDK